ncbi:MAG TPA: GatB/YqeY domain-containing protein [Frankiaceae bacterium]
MPTLAETLRTHLTAAMRAKDDAVTRTLRMTLTALTNESVSGKVARELTDDEVLAVVTKEAKKRREAAEAFTGAGRGELADRELEEAAVLDRYLPTQLTDAELTDLVAAAVASTGASGPRAIGVVMKELSGRTAGRADGGRVSAEVRRQLG